MPKRTVPAAGAALLAEGQTDHDALAHELAQEFFAGRSIEQIDRIKATLETTFPCPRREGVTVDFALVEIYDELGAVQDLVGAALMAAADLTAPEERDPLRAILDIAERSAGGRPRSA
jgi:hypothetical protein